MGYTVDTCLDGTDFDGQVDGYAMEIEYIDEMGYVYVSCPQCHEFYAGCERCMELSWALSQEFWALEDLARAARGPPPPVEYEEEMWE
ncbi:hypothetical protein M8J76_002119 [Diaphorina citri]|nr:hypothetical protein M8J76_003477 [Diaphorina citri]KAI5736320.1 hypothetical protein M8J76_002119 [Diaphorina citri]KAI5742285.1 hypothetical protein M8J77_005716 [Diaphorina citri]